MVKIICGLGNTGDRYRHTRHNLGFDVIEHLLERVDIAESGSGRWFDYHRVVSDSSNIFLVLPTTYVNRSGRAVAEALEVFNVELSEFFVIVDDFNLSLGKIRLRKSGSAGGHNGLSSIIEELDSFDFPRLRCGIGPLPEICLEDSENIPEFVLGGFTAEESKIVDTMIESSVEATLEYFSNGFDAAIKKLII
ncbi:MAG: aminoacyl-tRNA hydrolase [candidate division Zixibacteria bacterium]|nr:aminoacyl-tRNA hydrolase [candidate division Zixibacteria bacterium]